jgi:putative redox protein
VLVRQDSQFQTEFLASDPEALESEELQPVYHIHDLTPYGMLLASLGACTAIVLNTYAQHHDVDLQEVEVNLEYDRLFQEDCENCEHIEQYEERIREQVQLSGDLTEAEHDKLMHIAHQCSIYKMLQSGIDIAS